LGGVFTDSPTSESELYALAEGKIAAAAQATALDERAMTNTTAMLTTMLQALGYDQVEIRYQVSSAGPPIAPASVSASVDP
jgi:Holliday junction resolvasome RuvABC DNA-binding subunit